MPVEVGRRAPDFELPDQHGRSVRLSRLHRRYAVVLVFYPLAFSGVCGNELAELRDAGAELHNECVRTLTVSVDSMFVQRAWAEREGFEFPMLSDFWPHGEVARAYGVLDEDRGVATRATFILDTAGTVRWRVHNPLSEPRDVAAYRKALAELR